jgi:hypothetical protein
MAALFGINLKYNNIYQSATPPLRGALPEKKVTIYGKT